jgi:glycosyltransferase involved in cell wall biosynthesis
MLVHIFDPQLDFADGHYATYDAAIVAEFARRGIKTFVYGSIKRASSVLSGLEAEPAFSRGIFEEVATDPITWALENFVQLGREFHSDLARLGPDRFSSADLAFFPNIIQYQISGVADWIAELAPERRPAVILKPSYLTHAMPYLQRRPNKEMIPLLYRFSMRQLMSAHPRSWICSDTEEMVKQFGALSGIPIHLLPMPLVIDAQSPEPKTPPRTTVIYLGHASMLKGFHLLPEIVRRVLAAKDAPHFVIQSYGEGRLCADLERSVADVPPDKLTLVRGTVDAGAYSRLLNMADIVLLPYVIEFYGWASSGIFAEAMSLGKVAVATHGTWPAQQLEKFRGGGVVFKTLNAESVAGAIRDAVRILPQLRERAAQAAPAWRKYHCPANLADRLLALVS